MSALRHASTVLALSCLIGLAALSAGAGAIYPSVHQLQVALHMEPNTQVPQLIVVDGKVFHPRYLRTEDHFNGEYAVILKLDRER